MSADLLEIMLLHRDAIEVTLAAAPDRGVLVADKREHVAKKLPQFVLEHGVGVTMTTEIGEYIVAALPHAAMLELMQWHAGTPRPIRDHYRSRRDRIIVIVAGGRTGVASVAELRTPEDLP